MRYPTTIRLLITDTTLGDTPWPDASYEADQTVNIASYGANGLGNSWVQGIPAAGLRGGAMNYGTAAGVFALRVDYAPSSSAPNFGFRCVVPG